MRPAGLESSCRRAAVVSGALLAGVCLVGATTAAAAALKVNTTTDELGHHHRHCSLREAIAAVNSPGTASDCGRAGRASNTIVLGAGRYRLSLGPSNGDDNSTGDLNVTGGARLTIIGSGTGATAIDATGLGDRVLSIVSSANVTLRQLTIAGGHVPDAHAGSSGADNVSCAAGGAGANGMGSAGSGGGIYNSGTLVLNAVAVIGNTAGGGGAGGAAGAQSGGSACSGGNGGQGGSGGGIYNLNKLSVTASTIRANKGGAGGAGGAGGTGGDNSVGTGGPGGNGGQGGSGGAIYNLGRLSVTASTIHGNRAGAGGHGGPGGAGTLARGVDGAGGPGASGGAIFSANGALRVINGTFADNLAGAGGTGGGLAGTGGAGGGGGAIQVTNGSGTLRNVTLAYNGVGAGGAGGLPGGLRGASGSGGGIFVHSLRPDENVRLENTIVASSIGAGCAGNTTSAIANGAHNLSYGDRSCPGRFGNPKLGSLKDNGGPTRTFALGPGSTAIDGVPTHGAHCPATDQRGVARPERRACDIGAFEFALPKIMVSSPFHGGSYERGSRVLARFRCTEGGISTPVATCKGKVRSGHAINTSSLGTKSFKVTATDKSGTRVTKTIHYTVWAYTNPLSSVSGLQSGRIDMGVDYAGSGPLLALGNGRVTMASNNDSGPLSCWGRTCWPGGGIVVYRLSDGPFAGKYVYMAENITVNVSAGQRVKIGQQLATLHNASPHMETGWASGHGAETLAIAYGHQCSCTDPGGWSAIEGRNFDDLLVALGAPSGYLQPSQPNQSMPRGWPSLHSQARAASVPMLRVPVSEGWTARSR
jgi:CSLREA domain-containing protein